MAQAVSERHHARAVPEDVAVDCTGLVKRYADLTAVDGLDLRVKRGECFGLLGPNGAGKTTTVEILEGILTPDAGRVRVLGCAWGRGNDHALRQRLGVQLQETRFPEKLTVEEMVRLFRSFYDKGLEVEAGMRLVGLTEKRHARVGKLSGGQKQRLALACALVGEPELLFLDEPTTGLDPQARLMIWEIVEELRRRGRTVLLTTHYMEEASRLCDRVAIVDRGKVIAEGSPRELIDSLGAEQVLEIRVPRELQCPKLEAVDGVQHITRRNGTYVLTTDGRASVLSSVLNEVRRQGVEPAGLSTHEATLEDVFVHLTGRGLRDA